MTRMLTVFCLLTAAAIFTPSVEGNQLYEIQNRIEGAIREVLNLTATVAVNALKVQAEAEEQILDVFQDVQDRIEALQHEEAKIVCTVRAANELRDVAKNLTEGLSKCTSDKASEAKEVMDSVIDLFQRFNSTLQTAQERIANCKKLGLEALVVACQTQEEAKALSSVLPVINSSVETLIKVNHFVMSILNDLINCPKPYLAAARAAAKVIGKHIDQCVADISA